MVETAWTQLLATGWSYHVLQAFIHHIIASHLALEIAYN